jgi:hypothetical protein
LLPVLPALRPLRPLLSRLPPLPPGSFCAASALPGRLPGDMLVALSWNPEKPLPLEVP